MSFFILYDNNSFKVFNTAQDHKRIFEGDKEKIQVVWVHIHHRD